MALQFDQGAYGQAYGQGQTNEMANKNRLLQLLASLGQTGQQVSKLQTDYETKKEENTPLIQLLNKGGMNSSNSLGQPVANTPLPEIPDPMSQQMPPMPAPPQQMGGGMNYEAEAPKMNHVEAFQNFVKGQPTQTPAQPSLPYGLSPEMGNLTMKQLKSLAGDKSLFQSLKPQTEEVYTIDPATGEMKMTGKVPTGSKVLQPQPTNSPIYTVNPTTGKAENIGSAPRGSHFVNVPNQGATTANISYNTATPQERKLAERLVSGDVRPGDLSFRDRGRVVAIASDYANQQGIPFQSYSGDVKSGMAKNLAYGKMGMNALSFNTALGHIGDASKAYQNVQNTNQQWLNVPLNELKRKTNDPNIVALDVNLNAVAGELATVFKGSSGTDQEIGHWASVLTDNLTPLQAQAALKKAGELLNSRLGAMKYQQGNVMNQTIGERELISPHGQEIMNQLSNNNPPQSGPKPGEVDNGYIFKGGNPADPNAWVKQ